MRPQPEIAQESNDPKQPVSPIALVGGVVCLLFGALCLAFFLQAVLETPQSAAGWVSESSWRRIVVTLTGFEAPKIAGTATIPLGRLTAWCIAGLGAMWLVWGLSAALLSRSSPVKTLSRLGSIGGMWWIALGLLELVRSLFAGGSFGNLLGTASNLWFAIALAGFFTTAFCLSQREASEDQVRSRTAWTVLSIAMLAFVAVFTWMNWQLYWNLLLPHGDSAMYEEHLWNLTHGKGFRSYLDQGLFLGEHIQVIHLLLLPGHIFWPSQLFLELCESLALASAAVPVFLIARRHSGAPFAALLTALAWLFCFPVHYLEIAIDFKTFRPVCFGVPALLFAIDQWERKRFRTACGLLLLALSAKEDFALVLAPLALYFAIGAEEKRERIYGYVAFALITAYLILAVLVLIPAFRAGETVHYSRYFGELGSSPTDIVRTAFREPMLVLTRLFSLRSLVYALLLLLPCGFLPLSSPGRFIVGLPVFAMLCLLELSPDAAGGEQYLVPFHHFHATLLPIWWWAAAAGLKRFHGPGRRRAAAFALSAAISTGLFYSMTPAGLGFYDPGSRKHFRDLYIVSQRARDFEKVAAVIPQDARVASTDFVHTRLTHCDRSYDYSGYRKTVPADTDFIVIDARHPWPGYSMAGSPAEVRELQKSPELWELVDAGTDYFIVLRRIRPATGAGRVGD